MELKEAQWGNEDSSFEILWDNGHQMILNNPRSTSNFIINEMLKGNPGHEPLLVLTNTQYDQMNYDE